MGMEENMKIDAKSKENLERQRKPQRAREKTGKTEKTPESQRNLRRARENHGEL